MNMCDSWPWTQHLSPFIKPNEDSRAFVKEAFFTINQIIVSTVTWNILAVVTTSLISSSRIRYKHTVSFLPCDQLMSTMMLYKLHKAQGLGSEHREGTVQCACISTCRQFFLLNLFLLQTGQSPCREWEK